MQWLMGFLKTKSSMYGKCEMILPGDKGLLWGIFREGYLGVSRCLAIWIAEPN